MAKVLREVFSIETLSLHECSDGFYLYDTVVGMNIGMRAKTEQSAYIEALLYYQERLTKVEQEYKDLSGKVQSFVSQFNEEDF